MDGLSVTRLISYLPSEFNLPTAGMHPTCVATQIGVVLSPDNAHATAKESNSVTVPHVVPIFDMRPLADGLSLDVQGFVPLRRADRGNGLL